MFGVSFTELMLIGVVALVVVGPQRLPGMMSTVGKWSNKLRRMLFDVRAQSGIDEILRAEGITGGINEIRALRNAVRTNVSSFTQSLATGPRPPVVTSSPKPATAPVSPPPVAQTSLSAESDAFAHVPYDRTREYPDEGCDAYGAIPEDMWNRSRRSVAPAQPLPDAADSTDAVVVAAAAAVVEATRDPLQLPDQETKADVPSAGPSDANQATTAAASGDLASAAVDVGAPGALPAEAVADAPEPSLTGAADASTADTTTTDTTTGAATRTEHTEAAPADGIGAVTTQVVAPAEPEASALLPSGPPEATSVNPEPSLDSPEALPGAPSPGPLTPPRDASLHTPVAPEAEQAPSAPATETDVSQEPSVKVTVP